MNKDIKIARLESKLKAAQEEIKELKSEVRKSRSAKRAKGSKKKLVMTPEQHQLALKLLNDILTRDS